MEFGSDQAATKAPGVPAIFVCPVNPRSKYLQLFSAAFGKNLRCVAGSPDLIEDAIEHAHSGLLHIQWEEFFFKRCKSQSEADLYLRNFEELIHCYIEAKGKIVLTIHNLQPHIIRFHEHFRVARALLIKVASAIVVHNRASADAIQSMFHCDPQRIHQILHPSSVGVYESAADALTSIDGGHDEDLLIFGRIRRQKGIARAIAALPEQFLKEHGLTLAILGQGEHAATLQVEHVGRRDILWEIGYVPDIEAIHRLRRATCCILAYNHFLTSGVAHLVLSAGGLYVAPRTSQHLDLLPARNHRFLYRDNDDEDFRRAVTEVSALSKSERRQCRLANYHRAIEIAPERVAPQLADLYRSLLQMNDFSA